MFCLKLRFLTTATLVLFSIQPIGHALQNESNVSRQIKSSFICIAAAHSRSQLNTSLVNRAGSELLFTV